MKVLLALFLTSCAFSTGKKEPCISKMMKKFDIKIEYAKDICNKGE